MFSRTIMITAIIIVAVVPANAEPLPKPSEFAVCGGCHVTGPGQRPSIGPNLFGVSSRKAGESANYSYSAAMKAADIIWNRDTLSEFIADPKKTVPGTKMSFAGQMDPHKLSTIVDFLLSLK